jgi:hypothetical protein
MTISNLVYVELKSGYNDNGPAWICNVSYSKSRLMVYFNGKALRRIHGNLFSSHCDIETGEGYWN